MSGRVRLARGGMHRALAGHPWVFANEIDSLDRGIRPGDVVSVVDPRGRFVGRGFYNPRSQIAVRLVTRNDEPVDASLIRRLLERAWAHRQRLLPGVEGVRVVFAEADGLPGLIADLFGDLLVVQTLSLGIDAYSGLICDHLAELTGCRGVYRRNDAPVRQREGLPLEVAWAKGGGSTEAVIREHGLTLLVDVERGQKTGHFLDQRDNRLAARLLAPGGRVLDAFCHTGGFGLQAAAGGAREVIGVDSSAEALRQAARNAARNGLEGACRWREANAFDLLRELDRARERFDLVILDPPAFAKNRAALPGAVRGYKEINLRGIRLLNPGGYLITCSCSQHLSEHALVEIVAAAAADAGRRLRLLQRGGQPADHPVLLATPETAYLKCLVFQDFA